MTRVSHVITAVRTTGDLQTDALLGCFFGQSIFQNRYCGYVVGTELCFTTPAQSAISGLSEMCLIPHKTKLLYSTMSRVSQYQIHPELNYSLTVTSQAPSPFYHLNKSQFTLKTHRLTFNQGNHPVALLFFVQQQFMCGGGVQIPLCQFSDAIDAIQQQ